MKISGNYEIKKKLADQNVDLSKSHTPYDHHSRISPVVDNIFIHDSNIINNSVNSPQILKNILSNEQHESITKNKTIKLEKGKSHILDLDGLNKLSKEHQNNPIIGYLNINSLRNKINDLRKICRKTQIHVLCIDETKLDRSQMLSFTSRATSIPLLEKIAIKMGEEKLCM